MLAGSNWIALAFVFGLFGVWESFAPWRAPQGSSAPRWLTNTALLAIGAFSWRALAGAGVMGAAVLGSPRPLTAWRFLVAVVALDLARYGFHRAMHASGWLWRVHRVHHSDRELDCTSGFRFHPLESVLGHAWAAGCVFALGLHPLAVACSELLTMAVNIATHANVSIPVRLEQWLGAVFVTSGAHRIHHSADERDHGRNLGTVFAVWDRLFGTHSAGPAGTLHFGAPGIAPEQCNNFGRLCFLPILVAALLSLYACGPAACPGGDKVACYTAQLHGRCCEFSTEPTDAKLDGSCKVRSEGALVRLARGDRECVRWAAQCLGELGAGAQRAVPDLIELARSGPNNFDTGDGAIATRDSIIEALGRTQDPRALPVLLEALAHPRTMDRGGGALPSTEKVGEEAALTGLRLMGPIAKPAVREILPYLARPVKNARDRRIVEGAAAALAAIGDTSAVPALAEALGREETAIEVARALGSFGPSAAAALPALNRLVEKAPGREGQYWIREAFGKIGGQSAVDALPKSKPERTK